MPEKPLYEIVPSKDGKHYFHLKAPNGEVILAGRGYKTNSETVHAIASVMRFVLEDKSYIRRDSANGGHFFQLKTPSGRILGWSEMFTTKQAREKAIETVVSSCEYSDIIHKR